MTGNALLLTLPQQRIPEQKYVLGGEEGGEAIPSQLNNSGLPFSLHNFQLFTPVGEAKFLKK